MGGGLLALTSDFVNPQVWLTAVVALQRPSRLVGASYFRFTDMPPNILVLIFGVLFGFKGAAPRSWGVDLYPDNLYPVHAPRTPISQPMASSEKTTQGPPIALQHDAVFEDPFRTPKQQNLSEAASIYFCLWQPSATITLTASSPRTAKSKPRFKTKCLGSTFHMSYVSCICKHWVSLAWKEISELGDGLLRWRKYPLSMHQMKVARGHC